MKKKKYIRKAQYLRPKIIILSGYGLNCEEETKFAFETAGAKERVSADIVHINDLIAKPKMLAGYDIMAFPGGFSYGDDTGSGKAFANKFKNHLAKELEEFLSRDTLVIGICNGFQIVTNLGILPGALAQNKKGRYIDRWVDLAVPREVLSPWLKGIKKISVPIAHGEGHYVIPEKEYKKMSARGGSASGGKNSTKIAFTYVKGDICKFQNLEKNPNGSDYDIAGVLAYNGRVLGMMPHPERGMFAHQNPMWYKNSKKGKEGEGLQIFKNAIKYFMRNR